MRFALVRYHCDSGSIKYPAIIKRDFDSGASDSDAQAAMVAEFGTSATVEFFSEAALRDEAFTAATCPKSPPPQPQRQKGPGQ